VQRIEAGLGRVRPLHRHMRPLLFAGLLTACEPPPEAARAAQSPTIDAPGATVAQEVPAWLNMRPNFRREESSRLSNEAIAICTSRFPPAELRARLDSLLLHHGIERAETRSHPETTQALEEVLELQRQRQACIDSSPEYLRSREIVQETPDEFQLDVFSAPDSASEQLGTIWIRRVPDVVGPEQLAFTYQREGGPEAAWTLDRTQSDGYGGYFHTVLEQRGDWVGLPAEPFPVPVWIDWRATFESAPEVESIFEGIYMMTDVEAEPLGLGGPRTWDEPGVVFLRSARDRVWFRLETPSDMQCLPSDDADGPSEPGPDADAEHSLPIDDILDERGHLRLRVKYERGC